VLDPGGRLLDDRSGGLVVLHLAADGSRTRVPARPAFGRAPCVFELSQVPVGGRLLVRSKHLPPERLVAEDRPVTLARLRRGIPVQVTALADTSLPAPPDRLGLRLSRPTSAEEGDEVSELESVDPAAWQDDQDAAQGIVYLRAFGEVHLLEVPEAGAYELEWVLDGPMRRHSYTVRPFLEVAQGAGAASHVLEVPGWATRAPSGDPGRGPPR
jgi:hypothetical protein